MQRKKEHLNMTHHSRLTIPGTAATSVLCAVYRNEKEPSDRENGAFPSQGETEAAQNDDNMWPSISCKKTTYLLSYQLIKLY